MENIFSFLSTMNQVPTMSLILIFIFGLILGLLFGSAYEVAKYTKFLRSLQPKVEQLQETLRKQRELTNKLRFMELQKVVDDSEVN